MHRRTFIKGAVIAASTPTVTAFADAADNITLSHLIELHTLAYEADTAEWHKLADMDEQIDIARKAASLEKSEFSAAVWYQDQLHRCLDTKTVAERVEAAIFEYQLSTLGEVLMLTRWVHDRLNDCRCYFYEDERIVYSIFTQIARTA